MRHAAALATLLLLALAACRSAPAAVYSCSVAPRTGSFVVCGDTRGWLMGEMWRAPSGFERRAVFARLVQEHPDFIVNDGDLVSAGSRDGEWETFDREAAALRDAGIGYLPVLGNHDLWPDPVRGLENWFARFPDLEGRRWYERSYGYVRLLLLDTNESTLTPAEIADEEAWYRDALARADADSAVRCVLVVCHHSPFTNSFVHASSAPVIARFVDPARAHPKVRAFVSGHVHSYEHFVDGGIHFLVSGGGGAPLMDVAGPGGKFADLYDGPRGHHFCRLTPRDDRIDVEMVRLSDDGGWSVADSWSIGVP